MPNAPGTASQPSTWRSASTTCFSSASGSGSTRDNTSPASMPLRPPTSPAWASTGSGEAVDLRDAGEAFGGLDVRRAIGNVNGPVAQALAGMDASDLPAIDAAMIALDGTPNKSRLGGNAIVATSMAVLQA